MSERNIYLDPEKPKEEKNAVPAKAPVPQAQTAPAAAAPVPPPGIPAYVPPTPYTKTKPFLDLLHEAVCPRGAMTTLLCLLWGVAACETVALQEAGVSLPVLLLLYWGVLAYAVKGKALAALRRIYALGAAQFCIALGYFLHYNPSTRWIGDLTFCALVAAQLALLGPDGSFRLFSPETVTQIFTRVVGNALQNFTLPFSTLRVFRQGKSGPAKTVTSVLLGMLLALPMVGILLALFMHADVMFANAVRLLSLRMGFDPLHLFGSLLLGGLGGALLAACLLGLRYGAAKKRAPGPSYKRGSPVVMGTFLGVIDLVSLSFVAFQFYYLFGGDKGRSYYGLTYSEYARQGFFELCAASGLIFLISLAVLLFTRPSAREKNGTPALHPLLRSMVLALCACNGILLVSAGKRMLLYVSVYGLSVKRLLTLWLMILVGVCLLFLVVRCLMQRLDILRYIGVCTVTAVCILSLMNTEGFIARFNVDRALQGESAQMDTSYFFELSYSAAPQIDRLLDAGHLDNSLARALSYQKRTLTRRHPVYGFTLDSVDARRVFEKWQSSITQ